MSAARTFDVAVIGAGMAGAAAAFFLGRHASVVVLEQEAQPGYHSTGRSAALFTETYGVASTRALTSASRNFLESPPDGFCEHPLLRPRGVLLIGEEADRASMSAQVAACRTHAPAVRGLLPSDALALVPVLKPEAVACAMLEPDAMDIDTHALHSGYLRGARARGVEIVCNAAVETIDRAAGAWRLGTRAGGFEASVIVNAAGAWADE